MHLEFPAAGQSLIKIKKAETSTFTVWGQKSIYYECLSGEDRKE
jgi:hypothetical protein